MLHLEHVLINFWLWISSASIQACKRNRCRIVAFEENYAIFDAIVATLCSVNTSLAFERVGQNASLKDDDGPITKVAKHSRIGK